MTTAVAEFAVFADSQTHLLAGLAYVDLRIRWAVSRARANGLNPDDEFRGLYISDAHVDSLLNHDLGEHLWQNGNGRNGHAPLDNQTGPESIAQARTNWQARTTASRDAGIALRLDELTQSFTLTPPEIDALLITLAPELDPRYERLFAFLQDDVTRKRPSVDLILNLLTDSFDEKLQLRRLLADDGRLIQSQLLHRYSDSHTPLLAQFVRPAAHLVEFLLGRDALDSRLVDCARLLPQDDALRPRRLTPDFAQQLTTHSLASPAPLFIFIGGYGVGKLEAARLVAQADGRSLLTIDLARLAQTEMGLENGLRLALRDGRLYQAALYFKQTDAVLNDGRFPAHLLAPLLDYPHPVITAGEAIWQPRRAGQRPVFIVPFDRPDYARREHLWHAALGDETGVDIRPLANQFRFTPGQIEDAAATARDFAQCRGQPLSLADCFAASRAHSNQKLAALAAKIQPRYTWNDIILPSDTLAQLQEMVNTVRQRPIVYGDWGFDRKVALGKGLNALFAGESGTGKTMAADVMAHELGLDLYKIDLSTLVSKYIGETEKNLDRIFTEAATSNAILFFDEADAIFGKRSEVKDSHDRYANIEISYLLQRMEAFDGVVILATNLRANLDEAFTRRLHFVVEFPFPEVADRKHIWQVNFPPETPVDKAVDFGLLAQQFRLTGGNIRNIIMAAAFLAAEAEQSVGMTHLLHAARREYQKLGRLIDEKLFENVKRKT
jgi:AAA+ superfamily predicted ATPase